MNLLQSCVEEKLLIHKFDTAGTSEEYGNVHQDWRDKHDFHDDGRLVLHERSPTNPKSLYATSKLAAATERARPSAAAAPLHRAAERRRVPP